MPLPEDYEVEKSEGKEFDVIPTGEYICRIDDIEDMGESEYQGKTRKRLRFWFEVMVGEHAGAKLTRYITNTWFAGGRYSPSHLYQLVQAVYGEKVEDPPKNLNILIDGGLSVTVNKKKTEEGNEYSAVMDFAALDKDQKAKFEKANKEKDSEKKDDSGDEDMPFD